MFINTTPDKSSLVQTLTIVLQVARDFKKELPNICAAPDSAYYQRDQSTIRLHQAVLGRAEKNMDDYIEFLKNQLEDAKST